MRKFFKKALLITGVIGSFFAFTNSQPAHANSEKAPEYKDNNWCDSPGTGCILIDLDTIVIDIKK